MSNNYKDQYGKNTIKIIYKGKVVSQADMKVQLGGGDVIDKPVQTNITYTDDDGKGLMHINHQAIVVGESVAQVKRSTMAKVNDDGTISITQYKSEISSSGEEVYYYDNSIGGFRGNLEQAKVAFPNVDFTGLKLPDDIVDLGNPEFANLQYVSPDDLVEWEQVGHYDAEENGGKPTTWGAWADNVQTALDVAGLFPGLGEIADIANGCISLARGNYGDAALSFAAAVPFVGAAATVGKFAKKTKKAIDRAQDNKGVYDLIVKNGEDIKGYIGQSENVVTRMRRHFGKSGKLNKFTKVGNEILYKMPGSTKKEREVYEQYIILKKYGVDWKNPQFKKLLNRVNPVGGRFNLKTPEGREVFYEYVEENIFSRWDLPKEFELVNF